MQSLRLESILEIILGANGWVGVAGDSSRIEIVYEPFEESFWELLGDFTLELTWNRFSLCMLFTAELKIDSSSTLCMYLAVFLMNINTMKFCSHLVGFCCIILSLYDISYPWDLRTFQLCPENSILVILKLTCPSCKTLKLFKWSWQQLQIPPQLHTLGSAWNAEFLSHHSASSH